MYIVLSHQVCGILLWKPQETNTRGKQISLLQDLSGPLVANVHEEVLGMLVEM